jgi:hypothetical protein
VQQQLDIGIKVQHSPIKTHLRVDILGMFARPRVHQAHGKPMGLFQHKG